MKRRKGERLNRWFGDDAISDGSLPADLRAALGAADADALGRIAERRAKALRGPFPSDTEAAESVVSADLFAIAARLIEGEGLSVGRRRLAKVALGLAHMSAPVFYSGFYTEWTARLWLESHNKV